MATSTYEVVHPKLRLRTNGGSTRQEVGSHIEMDDTHAKKLVASGKIKKAVKKTVKKAG